MFPQPALAQTIRKTESLKNGLKPLGKASTYIRMCNALSPEKAVIWSVLQGVSVGPLQSAYFRHPVYRAWFDAANFLRRSGEAVDFANLEGELKRNGMRHSDADKRSLKRLLRVNLPRRIHHNAHAFAQSLADIHQGHRVHMESLIN